jgi:hypothetical protein
VTCDRSVVVLWVLLEHNLDNINLENISNSKHYWEIMKMIIKSNIICSNIPSLQNIIQDEGGWIFTL